MSMPENILKNDDELMIYYEELRKENKRKEEEELKLEHSIKQCIKKIDLNKHDFMCTKHSPDPSLILHFCSICYEKNKHLFT